MPPQNILISLRSVASGYFASGLDKRQYSIYTEKGKRATDQPFLPQSHFSAVDCFYRDFFAEPDKCNKGEVFDHDIYRPSPYSLQTLLAEFSQYNCYSNR